MKGFQAATEGLTCTAQMMQQRVWAQQAGGRRAGYSGSAAIATVTVTVTVTVTREDRRTSGPRAQHSRLIVMVLKCRRKTTLG